MAVLPKCREVAELLTEHSEDQLRGWQRVSVRFHLSVCPGCKCLQRQFDATRGTLSRLREAPAPEDLKARLLSELRKPK